MKHLFWSLFLMITTGLAVATVIGPLEPRGGVQITLVFVFFLLHPIGTFWMLYDWFRFRRTSVAGLLVALLPYGFIWYYSEQVRTSRLDREASERG